MRVFLTGATGFIGSVLVRRLTTSDTAQVSALVRPGRALASDVPLDTVEVISGALHDVDSYAAALNRTDVVIHLAGATGSARPSEYLRSNVDGTRILLDQCRRRGVHRFVHMSTIAVTFKNRTHYHYARSKELSERVVRQSGLNYVIVRPSLVLGRASPTWRALARAASSPLTVIPGNGRARIQPVWVEDVVDALTGLSRDPLTDATVELGGPDVLTFDSLLHKISQRLRHRSTRIIHLPAQSAIVLLARLERLLRGVLPVSAGQLYPFVNDSVARSGKLAAKYSPHQTDVNEMLDILTADVYRT